MDKSYLFNIRGYMFKAEGNMSYAEAGELEALLLDFLQDNGYQFIGWSDIEVDKDYTVNEE